MTNEQKQNLKPFVKGDPRCWRKGRPKSFDAARVLARALAHEPAKDKNGDPIVIDGHIATNAEMLLRSWIRDPKLQTYFFEVAFGKVPAELNLKASSNVMIYIPENERQNE